MKKLVKMLIIVVIFSVFSINAGAKEPEDYIGELEEVMPEGAKISIEDELSGRLGFDALLSEIVLALRGGGEVFGFFLLLVGCTVLSSLAVVGEGELSDVCRVGVGAICTTLVFSKIGGLFAEICDSLTEMANFFSAAVPIMTGISLGSGSGATAMVQNSGMTLTLWLLGGVGSKFFISVVGFSLAMALISSFGDEGCLKTCEGIKKFFFFVVGALSAILSAVFALQTVVASAADGAAMRAARYAASGLIPIVGGSVSGALSTVASGMAYAKGVVGAGAIWAFGAIALSPLIMLLLYRFCIAAVSSFADFIGAGRGGTMLSAFKFSLDSMIALYSLTILVYTVEIVMFMKGGAVLS